MLFNPYFINLPIVFLSFLHFNGSPTVGSILVATGALLATIGFFSVFFPIEPEGSKTTDKTTDNDATTTTDCPDQAQNEVGVVILFVGFCMFFLGLSLTLAAGDAAPTLSDGIPFVNGLDPLNYSDVDILNLIIDAGPTTTQHVVLPSVAPTVEDFPLNTLAPAILDAVYLHPAPYTTEVILDSFNILMIENVDVPLFTRDFLHANKTFILDSLTRQLLALEDLNSFASIRAINDSHVTDKFHIMLMERTPETNAMLESLAEVFVPVRDFASLLTPTN